jgi:hypothetical protein
MFVAGSRPSPEESALKPGLSFKVGYQANAQESGRNHLRTYEAPDFGYKACCFLRMAFLCNFGYFQKINGKPLRFIFSRQIACIRSGPFLAGKIFFVSPGSNVRGLKQQRLSFTVSIGLKHAMQTSPTQGQFLQTNSQMWDFCLPQFANAADVIERF